MATAFSFSSWSAATASTAAGFAPASASASAGHHHHHHHHHRRRRRRHHHHHHHHHHSIDIDIARICATFDRDTVVRVGNHVTTANHMPKFGDLTQYGISEETERRVWAAEVRRLAEAVSDPASVQLQGPAEWYGGDADANGYGCLHDLAHAFQMALEICTHDDLIVASHHHPHIDYTHPIALSYNRLERNFDDKIQRRKYEHLGRGGKRAFHAFVNYVTATVAVVLLRTAAADNDYNDNYDNDNDNDNDNNDDDDDEDDDDWTDSCLASLAQLASKMKVVGYDLPITTAISMAVLLRSQPLLSPMRRTSYDHKKKNSLDMDLDFDLDMDNGMNKGMDKKDMDKDMDNGMEERPGFSSSSSLGPGASAGADHVVPLIEFNQTIQQLLRDATATLLWDATTGQPGDMYETSAVIYDSGFHGTRRQLCQERNRRIGSSAGRRTVRAACAVFDVCRLLWSSLPDDDDRPVPCRTYLDWSWTSSGGRGRKDADHQAPETQQRSLTNMRDVITALVPYTMFCGPFPSTLARLVPDTKDTKRTSTPFATAAPSTRLASARIRTSQYCWLEAQLQAEAAEADGPPCKNVYDTALAQERALASSADDPAEDIGMKRRRHHAMNDRLRAATAMMESWTIGPHTITINDTWYCRTTCTAISLLVLGALSLILGDSGGGSFSESGGGGSGGGSSDAGGQHHQQQPPLAYGGLGLDRPNLIVLVWTAAGFLMAYVKSMRVESWPWHDFLRGQVVCRSVSEVHAVTKINPQTLLAALLWRDGQESLLKTSGPFCSLFRQHESGGFDIDIAPLNDTALAGGHLFVVVCTGDGPALIDLASRQDDDHYTAVPNVGSNTASADLRAALYCINARGPDHFLTFTKEQDGAGNVKTKKMLLPMYRLSDNGVLEWYRVLGVLDERAIFR